MNEILNIFMTTFFDKSKINEADVFTERHDNSHIIDPGAPFL